MRLEIEKHVYGDVRVIFCPECKARMFDQMMLSGTVEIVCRRCGNKIIVIFHPSSADVGHLVVDKK